MNNFFYSISILLALNISCKHKNVVNLNSNTDDENIKIIDSIFFKAQDIFTYNTWVITNRTHGNILRTYEKGIAKDFFWNNNQNLMNLKMLASGKLKYPKGKNTKEALFYGKWMFYGDADVGVYKIGYYKNGVKDSIWYTNYEDYIPLIKYYRNGKSIDITGNFIITDNTKTLAQGKEISNNGIPAKTWTFYITNEIKSEREFIVDRDSVSIIYKNISRTSGLIIDSGSYKESLEDIKN
ncbi:hypothetical protein [uncultured Algibacter sp.]|uniref:hypothetical protein n=1 Tax=uncultured Algibacter sp. TaxID=298659 RepID=UPI003217BEFA